MTDKDKPQETAPPAPAAETAPFSRTRYSGAVLICGECQKRSSGPSKLKAKDVRHSFKQEMGELRLRMRIVQSSCLGLCPKKAIAVTAVGTGMPAVLAEVHGDKDIATVAARIVQEAAR